jgi:short-subunit dehydrogenase
MGIKLQLICPGFVKTPLTAKNDFPMPFLIEVEEAAKTIVEGLDQNKFEIVFPRPMAIAMKFLRLLPDALYFWLIKHTTGAGKT